jgi:hypothetical protein
VKGQFNSPVDLPGDIRDPVPVAGPLVQVDPKADFATIVCVLVQGDMDEPADPNVPREPPVWVEGSGTWTRPALGDADWTGEVSRDGRVIGKAGVRRALVPGPARGIAIAVAVAEEDKATDGRTVPPRIDTITWCVNIELG